jgi:hypothetical protein
MNEDFKYNHAQLAVKLSSARHKAIVAGRGIGKTTIIADEELQLQRLMPRGKIGLIGLTYFHIKTKSMPVVINHWEKKGFIKDVHYYVGRKPPKRWKWDEAYQPLLNHTNAIVFWNGFTIEFLSMDRPEMARSGSYDFLIGDEAAKIKREPLNSDILPANRGNNDRFGHLRRHHGSLWCTTHALNHDGEWIYEYKEYAKEDKNYFYLEASAEENRDILGDEFFSHNKRVMTSEKYNFEILNIKPTVRSDSFYPKFNINIHGYNPEFNYNFIDDISDKDIGFDFEDSRKDKDVIGNRPLDVSFDFGSKINCMVIGQEQFPKYRIVKNLYVTEPMVLKELVAKFINYYRYHPEKTLFLYGGSDGRKRSDYESSETYFQKIHMQLNRGGWTVIDCYRLSEIPHKEKFMFFQELFGGYNPTYPEIEINNENALDLILSIQNSPLLPGIIEKDKRAERKETDQVKTTHLSDTMDNLLYWKFAEQESDARNFMATRM